MVSHTNQFLYIEELIKFHFSLDLQSGYQAYKNDCAEYFSHNINAYTKTQDQLLFASSLANYDWREMMRRNNFFRYHDLKTNEELLLDLQVLCWDVFFPESILSIEKKIELVKLIKKFIKGKQSDNNVTQLEFEDVLAFITGSDFCQQKIDKYQLMKLFFDPNIPLEPRHIIWGLYEPKGTSWVMYSEKENGCLQLDHTVGSNKWYISIADDNVSKI